MVFSVGTVLLKHKIAGCVKFTRSLKKKKRKTMLKFSRVLENVQKTLLYRYI